MADLLGRRSTGVERLSTGYASRDFLRATLCRVKYLLVALAACTVPPTARSPEHNYSTALAATVAIHSAPAKRLHCAGVSVDHFVVTAAHCVTHASTLWVSRYQDGDVTFEFGVTYLDQDADLAVLAPLRTWMPRARAELSPEPGPRPGSAIAIVGHPLRWGWTITLGVLSHPYRAPGPRIRSPWAQISAPVYPGNSGGPVFDRLDRLVGIVSFTMLEDGGGIRRTGSAARCLGEPFAKCSSPNCRGIGPCSRTGGMANP